MSLSLKQQYANCVNVNLSINKAFQTVINSVQIRCVICAPGMGWSRNHNVIIHSNHHFSIWRAILFIIHTRFRCTFFSFHPARIAFLLKYFDCGKFPYNDYRSICHYTRQWFNFSFYAPQAHHYICCFYSSFSSISHLPTDKFDSINVVANVLMECYPMNPLVGKPYHKWCWTFETCICF